MSAFPSKFSRPPTLSQGLRSMLPTRSSSVYPDEGMEILAEQSRSASLQARQHNLTLPDARLLPMDQVWQELERSQAYKEGSLEPGTGVITPEGVFLLALERGDWDLYQTVKDITLTADAFTRIRNFLNSNVSVNFGQVRIIWDLRSKFNINNNKPDLTDRILIETIKNGDIDLFREILQSTSLFYRKENLLAVIIKHGYNDLAREMVKRLIRDMERFPLDELVEKDNLESWHALNEFYQELFNHPLDWTPSFQEFLGGLGSALRDSNPDYEFDKYPDDVTTEEAGLAQEIREMIENWWSEVMKESDYNREYQANNVYFEAIANAIKSDNFQFAEKIFDDYMETTYELESFWHELNDLVDLAAGLRGDKPMPELLTLMENHLPTGDIPEKTRLRHICVAVCQGGIDDVKDLLGGWNISNKAKYTRDIEHILLQSLQLSVPSIYVLLRQHPVFVDVSLKQILNKLPSYRVSLSMLKYLQDQDQLDDVTRLLLIARSGTDNLETISFLGENPGLTPLEYWHAITILMQRTIRKGNETLLALLNSSLASEYLNLPVDEIRAEMGKYKGDNVLFKSPEGKSMIETLLSMIGLRAESLSQNITPVIKKLISLSRTPININVYIWQHIERTGNYDLYLFLLQEREYGRVKISDHALQNFSLMLRQRGLLEMAKLADEYALGVARKSMARSRL